MVDEPTAEIVESETAEMIPVSDDIVVLARDPAEMAEAQKGLIGWMGRKVASLRAELAEAEENLATAKRMKVRTQGWVRVVRLARGRVLYYEKAQTALEEGYCIIPDFPVQIVAVRTSRGVPPGKWFQGEAHRVPQIATEQLPEGDGRYVGPDPLVRERVMGDRTQSRAIDFQDVDFPFKRVKPQILSGLETAMKRKLFDEIGILPGTAPCGDPVLVGRIKRKEGTYQESTLTFLIAWWIDTRDL